MKSRNIIAISLLFFSGLVFAAQSPVVLLQQTSNELLTALKNDTQRNSQSLYGIVRKVLLPHVDLDMVSELAVNQPGNPYWNKASQAQREQFKKAFTWYITRTYSSALSTFRDEKINFSPRIINLGKDAQGRSIVQINSRVDQGNGQNVSLNYKLVQENGDWKVFDLIVDGISMVKSYNSQFASTLQNQGFAGLLQRLEEHNSKQS